MFQELLLLLVMIDPSDKALLTALLARKSKQITRFVLVSNFVGFLLLVLFTWAGTFILKNIFLIELDALRVAGGVAIAFIGFDFMRQGEQRTLRKRDQLADFAIVPIGTPLITGPAVITTVITMAAEKGPLLTSIAGAGAIILNTAIMLVAAHGLRHMDEKIAGAFIRIIGLFIMALGAQMAMMGLKAFFAV